MLESDESAVLGDEEAELLRAGYEAFARGDLSVIGEFLDPDVEYQNPEYAIESGVRRGREQFRAALARMLETFDYDEIRVERVIAAGERIVIAVRVVASGKGSGVPLDEEFFHVWTIRDGKGARFEWFATLDEALEAARAPRDSPDVERMRNAYAAMGRGDLEAVLELVDPDAEMRDRPEIPDPRTYRGHEGVRQSLESSFETFETFELIPDRFIEVGDRIVAILHMVGQGRGSGVPVEGRIAHLWTLRNGRAYRLQAYSDPEEAIAAARAGDDRAAEQANVELVRQAYEAWQAGEVERAWEFLHPDIEWVEPPEAPEADTWHGPEGARFSTERWTASWSEYEIDLVELVPRGERVLVRARQRGRGEGSGALVESDIFHVWTVRDGRAVRMEMYLDGRSAFEAAGLDPGGVTR